MLNLVKIYYLQYVLRQDAELVVICSVCARTVYNELVHVQRICGFMPSLLFRVLSWASISWVSITAKPGFCSSAFSSASASVTRHEKLA